MKKKINGIFRKHWNCLPWLLCGISAEINGEVKMYQYQIILIALLVLTWYKLPLDDR